MRRALKALTQFRRFPEIVKCRSLTRDWLRLTLTYVGFSSKFPFSINLATGPFEFREPSDVPTFWQIFLACSYPVRPADLVIVDAGANIGSFTLYALLHSPKAHVVAIEPAPDSCDRLRRLISAHQFSSRCTILQAALSGEIGSTTIQTGPGSQFRVTGQGGVTVATVTLDSLVAEYSTVDLLKLDAEGAEYQAIPNASAETLERIRRIEMEYHPSGDPQSILDRLAQCGFQIETVRGNPEAPGYGMATLSRPAKITLPAASN